MFTSGTASCSLSAVLSRDDPSTLLSRHTSSSTSSTGVPVPPMYRHSSSDALISDKYTLMSRANSTGSAPGSTERQKSRGGSCKRRVFSKADSCDSDSSDSAFSSGSGDICDCDSCLLGFDDATPGEMTDYEFGVKRGNSSSSRPVNTNRIINYCIMCFRKIMWFNYTCMAIMLHTN